MAAPRGGKKGRVDFIKPSDPAFLRRLKEQIGYKEPTTVDAKREALPACEPEDEEDGYDERPTVVVLKAGDLTQEEAHKILGVENEESKGAVPAKPVFKKPEKRKAIDSNDKEEKEKSPEKVKKVSNKSLLSFDEEEEDDDDDET